MKQRCNYASNLSLLPIPLIGKNALKTNILLLISIIMLGKKENNNYKNRS